MHRIFRAISNRIFETVLYNHFIKEPGIKEMVLGDKILIEAVV